MGKVNSLKTHCPRGHLYSGPNLIINSKGARECRECKSMHKRRAYSILHGTPFDENHKAVHANSRKLRCPKKHSYVRPNLSIDARGSRVCCKCNAMKSAKQRKASREEMPKMQNK